MKLFYSKGSCSLAVRIVINELKLACDFEAVDLKAKTTEKGTNYLTINPKGAVPFLVVNDSFALSENAVIQQYLADRENANHLLPPINQQARYKVLEWLNFVSTDMHKGFTPLFNPKIDEAMKAEVFIPLMKSKLKFIDQHLSANTYLAGNNFTLPDGYLFVILRWCKLFKINFNEFANLKRYIEDLQQREAIKQSLVEEQLEGIQLPKGNHMPSKDQEIEAKIRQFVDKLSFTDHEIAEYSAEFNISPADMRRMASKITKELKHDLEEILAD